VILRALCSVIFAVSYIQLVFCRM